jgi:hypothetical protein
MASGDAGSGRRQTEQPRRSLSRTASSRSCRFKARPIHERHSAEPARSKHNTRFLDKRKKAVYQRIAFVRFGEQPDGFVGPRMHCNSDLPSRVFVGNPPANSLVLDIGRKIGGGGLGVRGKIEFPELAYPRVCKCEPYRCVGYPDRLSQFSSFPKTFRLWTDFLYC